MTKQSNKKSNYFIVAPGLWSGSPLRYSSLKDALKDFIAGVPFGRIEGTDSYINSRRPKTLNLTEEISFGDLIAEEGIVSAKCSASKLSKNQPFYLIRTYTFYDSDRDDCRGYDVVESRDISELQKVVNTNIPGTSNLKNILTRGLELKLLQAEEGGKRK